MHTDQTVELAGNRPWRRFRLSLRLAMALVAVATLPLAWWLNSVHAERRAVAAIRHAGGFVDRGFRRTPTGSLLPKAPNPAPRWLLRLVPEDYFQAVNFVSVRGPKVDDAILAQIAELSGVKEICLTGSGITDNGLAQLRDLKGLKDLWLDGTQIGDAGLAHLAGLHRLRYLNLTGTRVTDAGLSHLAGMDQLVKLLLGGTDVSDAGLEHLKSHRGLVSVSLPVARINTEGAGELKRSLPRLQNLFRVISGEDHESPAQ